MTYINARVIEIEFFYPKSAPEGTCARCSRVKTVFLMYSTKPT